MLFGAKVVGADRLVNTWLRCDGNFGRVRGIKRSDGSMLARLEDLLNACAKECGRSCA